MMIFSFLLIVTTSSMAQANTVLYRDIADSIDSLLSDTVNEGEMTAEVSRVRGKPAMTCTLAPYREQGKGIAKCDITFNIVSNYSEETQRCQQSCFLISVYDLKTSRVTSRVESLEQACLENLSSACD